MTGPADRLTPGSTPATGSPARLVLLLVVSVVLTLTLLESLMALGGYEYAPVHIEIGRAGDARSFHTFEDRNFEHDADLIWRPRPSQSVFNSQGFRGPELASPKPPGSLRIFAIGDSNTLGWAGGDGANWPGLLHEQIHRLRDGADVVNAGVWGYSSYQGLRRFRQTLAFDPDVVLISFGSNDAHRVLESDRDYAEHPIRDAGVSRLLERSRLGQLVLSALDGVRRGGRSRTVQPRVSLDEYRANLNLIVDESRGRGIEVVLLTRPYVGSTSSPYWWKNWGHEYNAATVEVAASRGVRLVDIYSFFKHEDRLFADESHFTAEGHERAAALILDHIRPLVMSGGS